MGKRLLVPLLCGIFLALSGCWNYRGLDELNMVVGIAIDFDTERNMFLLHFEVADVANTESKSAKERIIGSEGKTLFDAVRNAKRKEEEKLFFGSANIVIISQTVASEIGLMPILDWFLRDGECRETMCLLISLEETAKEILEGNAEMSGLVSDNLHYIVDEDRKVTASAVNNKLYQVYNALESKRNSAMITALHRVGSEGLAVGEINGTAVFHQDKLRGFFSVEESKYALFVEDLLEGGLITLSTAGNSFDDTTLEIFKNKTKKSFSVQNGSLVLRVETDTIVSVGEIMYNADLLDSETIRSIESAAAEIIENRIRALIARTQTELQTDVFGFGEMIYRRDFKLWKQIQEDWLTLYPTLTVETSARVSVTNTMFVQ